MGDASNRDRRFMVRYPSKAGATIIRESDMMRAGIPAKLVDVTSAGLGITCSQPLPAEEAVKIHLMNQVQRFSKETRGIIKYCTQVEDEYRIGVELLLRLTPLEVSLLKMGLESQSN